MSNDSTWSQDDIEDEICSIVASATEKPLGVIHADAALNEGIGYDSLALIETQVAIEERFGIVMPDIDEQQIADLHTVKDLAQAVAREVQGGADDD